MGKDLKSIFDAETLSRREGRRRRRAGGTPWETTTTTTTTTTTGIITTRSHRHLWWCQTAFDCPGQERIERLNGYRVMRNRPTKT